MTKYKWVPAENESGKLGLAWQMFEEGWPYNGKAYHGTAYKLSDGTFNSFGGEFNLSETRHKSLKEAANRILSEAKEKGRKA